VMSYFTNFSTKRIDKLKLSHLVDPLAKKIKNSLRNKFKNYMVENIRGIRRMQKSKKYPICLTEKNYQEKIPYCLYNLKKLKQKLKEKKCRFFNHRIIKNERTKKKEKTVTCSFKGICFLYKQALKVINNNNKFHLKKVDTTEKLIDIVLPIDNNYRCGRLEIKLTKLIYPLLDNEECLMEAKILDQVPDNSKSKFISYKIKIVLQTIALFFNIVKRQAYTQGIFLFQEEVKTSGDINLEHLSKEFGSVMTLSKNFKGIDPPDDVVTVLKQHQRIALEWLLLRENSDSTVNAGKQYNELPTPFIAFYFQADC